jgi:HEAT repeat protein
MNRDILPRVTEAIVIMNKATKNLRLYPPSSAIVVNTIDQLQEAFLDIFALEDALDFAEAEERLLVGGEALPPKEQERPQVVALVEMLLNFSLKSISFQKGMSREELLAFLELITQPPGHDGNRGDALQAVMEEKQITHILMNQKVYIAKGQDNQLLASLDIKDDDIVKYMAEVYPEQDFDIEKIRGMVQDEAWVSTIFQSGMQQIMKDQGIVSSNLLTKSMMHLFTVLDKITSLLDQENICRLIAKSIADLAPEMISQILSQDLDHIFGGELFQQVVDQLSDEKVEQVAQHMRVIDEEHALADSAGQSMDVAYKRLLATEKGREMQLNVAARQLAELTEQEQEKVRLHEQVQQIIKDSDDQFLQSGWITSLSNIVIRILDVGEQGLAEALIERIVRGLASEVQDVRDGAAAALVEVITSFPADGQLAQIERNAGPLLVWINREPTASLAYRKICSWLKDVTRDLILRGSFTEAKPILEVFNRIHHGLLDKNDTITAIAADTIRELASGELLTILFDEFDNNRQNKQFEAGLVLVRLGDTPLNRFLDILRENEDSNLRVRILQVITDIGLMAVPVIRERLQVEEPWYYVRNMAYLLGKVGAESTAHVLQPLMLHKNNRVREEALKSLHRTGGNARGPLMMSVLLTTDDDEFKLSITETLGSIKYSEAEPALLDMLQKRPVIASAARINLEEKICTILGKIGSASAFTALKEISQPKFFLVKKYPENVRKAATRALVAIEGRQADEARKARR